MASPYAELAGIREALQNLMAKMLAMKQAGQGGPERRKLLTEAAVLLIELRQLNRVILRNEEEVKLQTEAAKEPVDSTTLKLHNLLYEKNHYMKAIKACNDFKSKYPDIDLVPEEEFFARAPLEFRGDPELRKDPHKLMLQRLNYELYQRKELAKHKEVLETRKRTLQDSINGRKKFMGTLPDQLKALKAATLPVQQQLGLLHSKKLHQHKRAELLPAPMFILYSQLMSYRDVFGENISVEVMGSAKEASAFLRAQALRDAGIGIAADEVKEEEAGEDEEDGKRRRKRRKQADEVPVHTESEKNAVHPLIVILKVYDDDQSVTGSSSQAGGEHRAPLAVVHFEYLCVLHLICAFADGDDGSLLTNLFPGDTGLELPNPALKLRADLASASLAYQRGRPYKWAQYLSGLDFLPELPPSLLPQTSPHTVDGIVGGLAEYRRQHRIQNVLQQLRLRCKALKALKEQLESLRKLKRPSLPRSLDRMGGREYTPKCTLRSWAAVAAHPQQPPLSETLSIADGNNSLSSKCLSPTPKSGKSPVVVDESGQEDGELPGPSALPSASASHPLLAISEAARLRTAVAASAQKTLVVASTSRLALLPAGLGEVTTVTGQAGEAASPAAARDGGNGGEGSSNTQSLDGGQLKIRWQEFGLQRFKALFRSDYPSASSQHRTSTRMELEATVEIYGEYPVRPPLFRLRWLNPPAVPKAPPPPDGVLEVEDHTSRAAGAAPNPSAIRAMEAEVNLCGEELDSKHEVYMLAFQIHHLMRLLDAFVDQDVVHRQSAQTAFSNAVSVEAAGGDIVVDPRAFRGRHRAAMPPSK